MFAVNCDGVVARPELSVVAVVVAVFFAKVPDAPVAGAVNVTVAPETGFPYESTTWAFNAVPNAVATVADWFDPADTDTAAAPPAAFVSEKFAEEAPESEAVTV